MGTVRRRVNVRNGSDWDVRQDVGHGGARIGGLVAAGLKQQAQLDLASLEAAIGRTLSEDQREAFLAAQHQAMRWTFLGSALVNKGFLQAPAQVRPQARSRDWASRASVLLSTVPGMTGSLLRSPWQRQKATEIIPVILVIHRLISVARLGWR